MIKKASKFLALVLPFCFLFGGCSWIQDQFFFNMSGIRHMTRVEQYPDKRMSSDGDAAGRYGSRALFLPFQVLYVFPCTGKGRNVCGSKVLSP